MLTHKNRAATASSWHRTTDAHRRIVLNQFRPELLHYHHSTPIGPRAARTTVSPNNGVPVGLNTIGKPRQQHWGARLPLSDRGDMAGPGQGHDLQGGAGDGPELAEWSQLVHGDAGYLPLGRPQSRANVVGHRSITPCGCERSESRSIARTTPFPSGRLWGGVRGQPSGRPCRVLAPTDRCGQASGPSRSGRASGGQPDLRTAGSPSASPLGPSKLAGWLLT